ncbi:MAG: hypothetical protein RAO94_14015 [Candidatus Stygibacter australis]|nr:hypothetical protein [Candidatus Stygibacter australis]MDP8323457.1 hypothetical protein [Candidatus Stygibacter australis]
MLRKILAMRIIVVLLLLLLAFHILVVMQIIPGDFVWGGQIEANSEQLINYEIFAAVITCLFLIISFYKIKLILENRKNSVNQVGLWLMLLFFLLGILGNLSSDITKEKLIFTPVTVLLSLFILRVIIK